MTFSGALKKLSKRDASPGAPFVDFFEINFPHNADSLNELVSLDVDNNDVIIS